MDKSTMFSMALKASGLTMGQWIARYLKPAVSESHVYNVLRGVRTSDRISRAVDRFIEEQRPRMLRSLSGNGARQAA